MASAIPPIDPMTLEQISGESGLKSSTNLLDNTLKSLEMKKWSDSMNQQHQLRTMEITRTAQELNEWQRQADIRDMQSQITRKTAEHTIERLPTELTIQDELRDLERVKGWKEKYHEGADILYQAPNNAAYQKELNRLESAGVLTPNMANQWRSFNFDSDEDRAAFAEVTMIDREYLQELAMARASSTSNVNLSTKTHPAQVMMALKDSDFSPEEVNAVAGSASKISADMTKMFNASISDQQIAQVMSDLYTQNEDEFRYFPDPETGSISRWMGWGDKLDIIKLEEKAVEVIKGYYAQGTNASNMGSTAASTAEQMGITTEQWNQIKQLPEFKGLTDEEIILELQGRGY